MASFAYDNFEYAVQEGTVVPATDVFYVMLVGSGYTPSEGGDVYRSAVTANEVPATGGYATGGVSVSPTVSKNTSLHNVVITLPGYTWASSTISAAYAVYYKHRGGLPSADELVAVVDFGGTVSSSGGNFVLNPSTITLNTAS